MSETSPLDLDHSPQDRSERAFLEKNAHSFLAEVLVSSGPRKSAYEYGSNPAYAEWCEDCAGTCWVGDRLVFWLCDGASNGMVLLPLAEREGESEPPPVFGFSARALAKDLGQAFVEQLCDALPRTKDLQTLEAPTGVFAAVACVWNERFTTYVSQVEKRGNREKLIDALPRASSETYRIGWSSTFLGGVFDPWKRRVSIVNYGDGGGLLFTLPEKTIIPPNKNPVRLFAEVKTSEPLAGKVTYQAAETQEWMHAAGVSGFSVMSDGIDHDLLPILEQMQSMHFSTLSDLRAALLRNAAVSWDDKSIVFGRFQGE